MGVMSRHTACTRFFFYYNNKKNLHVLEIMCNTVSSCTAEQVLRYCVLLGVLHLEVLEETLCSLQSGGNIRNA